MTETRLLGSRGNKRTATIHGARKLPQRENAASQPASLRGDRKFTFRKKKEEARDLKIAGAE